MRVGEGLGDQPAAGVELARAAGPRHGADLAHHSLADGDLHRLVAIAQPGVADDQVMCHGYGLPAPPEGPRRAPLACRGRYWPRLRIRPTFIARAAGESFIGRS